MVYTGAEVTSEGFQVFGLPPYAYYSAGYACYLSDQDWMQDNHDVWCNDMDVAGVTNGGIVGFKYFGFGGLDKADKGVNPFAGAKKGDGTQLDLFLTPGRHGAFKIHVMLDGPYANATWKGREIAVVDVPDGKRGELLHLTVPVPAVEGLTGKHAIYLVAEGPEVNQPEQQQGPWGRRGPQQPQRPQGLFDLHGVGFKKGSEIPSVPVVPEVTITVDGQKLNIPDRPIMATNQNGYTECNHYQLYAPRKDGSKIEAKASDPHVTFTVIPGIDYRATVRATYQGKEKVFLIN
jgi:hypothetical protein